MGVDVFINPDETQKSHWTLAEMFKKEVMYYCSIHIMPCFADFLPRTLKEHLDVFPEVIATSGSYLTC